VRAMTEQEFLVRAGHGLAKTAIFMEAARDFLQSNGFCDAAKTICDELNRLEQAAYWGTYEHSEHPDGRGEQFRSGLMAVEKALQDEAVDPAERIKAARAQIEKALA